MMTRKVYIFVVISLLVIGSFFSSSAQVNISVSGKPLIINGADKIPVGMFGVHSTTLSAETAEDWGVDMVRVIQFNPGSVTIPGNNSSVPANIKMTIDCFWDRYHPALQLTNPGNWQEVLETKAINYANSVRNSGYRGVLEFWNESYLNWASKPAVNYDPRYYQQEGLSVNDPVKILGQTDNQPYLVWKSGKWLEYVSGQNDGIIGNYVFVSNNWSVFGALQPGTQATVNGRTFRSISTLIPTDTTQLSFYSSRQNGRFYDQMLIVFGSKLKSLRPEIPLIAGWGMNIFQENWRPWHTLYKPTIDTNIQWIDGIHEHHYGGDTRTVTASYEVVTAYTDRQYNKRLLFYNTEAGGQLDPQQPGNVGSAPVSPVGAMTYALRDIIFNLSRSPDKAVARASHQAHLNGGDPFAFRLLKPLRGELLYTESANDNIWVVASKHNDKMAIVIFNDDADEQTLNLDIKSPLGMNFDNGQKLSVNASGSTLAMNTESVTSSGSAWQKQVVLAGKTAVTYVFNLSGSLSNLRNPVNIDQFFAGEILENFTSGQSKTFTIPVPANKLNAAESARLKFIIRSYAGGGTLLVNGNAIPLTSSSQVISFLDIPKSYLSTNNQVSFTAGSSGFQVWMTSLELIDADQPLAPVINSFTPARGAADTVVTILGERFSGVTEVLFNGVKGDVISVTNSQIKVKVPAKTTTGRIKVLTANGSGTSSNVFVAAPFITGISPFSGIIGSNVVISGGNFDGVAVRFNEVLATQVSGSDELLNVKVPSAATTGKISLTSQAGTALSAENYVVIPSPIISQFSPLAASSGMVVKIQGTNFTGATAVRFGTASTSALVKVTNTEIQVIVPRNATSGVIGITTALGTTNSSQTFNVLPPITSFSPVSGAAGSQVTVTGSGFSGGTFKVNGSAAQIIENTGTSAVVTVPAGASTGKISFENASGIVESPGNFVVTGSNATQNNLTVPATSDALVFGAEPNGNFGAADNLVVRANGGGGFRMSVLRFTVPQQVEPAGLSTVKLRLYGRLSDGSSTNIPAGVFHYPDGAWKENEITYSNSVQADPRDGNLILDTRNTNVALSVATVENATAKWYEWDLTAYVQYEVSAGRRIINLAVGNISISNNLTLFNSKENGSNKPELLLTTLTGPSPVINLFSPKAGTTGTPVTITGTDLAGAEVFFSDTKSIVTSNNGSSITTTVPAGATTGLIKIKTASGTVVSTTNFVVQIQGSGLKATYFNNKNFTGFSITRVDSVVNFNWGQGSPHPQINKDNFAARWTGMVQAKYSEKYTFYTRTDDGVRLWVNGIQLVNKWKNQSATMHSGTINLTAGEKYAIVMEYYDNKGGAIAQLSWSSPSEPVATIIAKRFLFPDNPLDIITATRFVDEEYSSDDTQQLLLYPNPAGENLNVKFFSEYGGEALVKVTNLLGQEVITRSIAIQRGSNVLEIPVDHLENGMYIFSISVGSEFHLKKKLLIEK